MSSEQTCPDTSSHCYVSSWWFPSSQRVRGRAQGAITVALLELLCSLSTFRELSSFTDKPGVQRAVWHHMYSYFFEELCTGGLAIPEPPSSINVGWCCSLGWGISCVGTAEPTPALLHAALMPASKIASPDFLVNDLRQNRDNWCLTT